MSLTNLTNLGNLGELLATANSAASVLIVGDAKAGKAAKAFVADADPRWVAVWLLTPVAATDLAPLAGRTLAYWPKAGADGRALGDAVKAALPECKVITPPDGLEDGWGLAEAKRDGWESADIMAFLTADLIPATTREPSGEDDDREDDGYDDSQPLLTAPPPPFRCLGYYGDNLYFLPQSTGVLKVMTSTELTQANLVTLAPPSYWKRQYPKDHEDPTKGTNWRQAADNVLWGEGGCYQAGMFDIAKIRGVGCWRDGQQIILHTGDTCPFGSGRYIYERDITLEVDFGADPLGDEEAAKLLKLCEMLNWTKPISAIYLAGFCAVATLAGALPWRSHIWITGPAGSGKSTAFNRIVEPCIESWGVYVQGATTEPAIRRLIGRRAMVLMFDEAEGNTPKAQDRMMAVIEYLRACSTTSRAVIAKATAGDSAMTFIPQAMGCMASIGVTATASADLSRIEILELSSRNRKPFELIKKAIHELFGDGTFGARLRARSFRNAANIIKNSETFKKAVAAVLTDRAGDQLGVLFAGAYSLFKPGLISYEAACEFISRQDFSERRAGASETDEQMFLRMLLDKIVKVTPSDASGYDRTIGELVVMGCRETLSPERTLARETLERYGVRCFAKGDKFFKGDDGFAVSNSHKFLVQHVYGGQQHGPYLKRLEGSVLVTSMTFGAAQHRATFLPLTVLTLLDPSDEPQDQQAE